MQMFLLQLTGWCAQFVGLVWLVAAAYFAAVRQGTPRQKAGHFLGTLLPEPLLLLAVPAIVLVVAVVPAPVWHHLTYRSPVLAVPGAVLVVASTVLMCWARWAIGAMWAGRPLVQRDHELCTDGPYRLVRHPIYAGIAGLVAGYALVAGFGPVIPVVVGGALLIGWRVRREERLMLATFGDRYRRYRAEVPALIPARPAVR